MLSVCAEVTAASRKVASRYAKRETNMDRSEGRFYARTSVAYARGRYAQRCFDAASRDAVRWDHSNTSHGSGTAIRGPLRNGPRCLIRAAGRSAVSWKRQDAGLSPGVVSLLRLSQLHGEIRIGRGSKGERLSPLWCLRACK